jgi:hypothetical protein
LRLSGEQLRTFVSLPFCHFIILSADIIAFWKSDSASERPQAPQKAWHRYSGLSNFELPEDIRGLWLSSLSSRGILKSKHSVVIHLLLSQLVRSWITIYEVFSLLSLSAY